MQIQIRTKSILCFTSFSLLLRFLGFIWYAFDVGGKNSDSDDEQPQPKRQKNEHHHNPGMPGLPHGIMPPNVIPSQFGPMMGHMGHIGPPFIGGG